MSQHHRRQKWSTHSPKLRKLIEPQLPLRCLNCPHPVMPGEKFQVGHKRAAMDGGMPSIENVGPTHDYCPYCRKRCNQVDGGKRGARVTNARRRGQSNRAKGIRAW